MDFVDGDTYGVPCFEVEFAGSTFAFRVPAVGASWRGTVASDGTLKGTLSRPAPQGNQTYPIVFTREPHPIPQVLFTAQDAATLEHMLRDWFAAFSAKDYSAVAHYFSVPYTAIGRRTFVTSDMATLRTDWVHTREVLNDSHYARTEVLAVHIIPRSATQALLNIHWRRVNRDGSTLNDGSEFYLASRQSGQWHFDGSMSQVRQLFGKEY